jgi:hypothetical protein
MLRNIKDRRIRAAIALATSRYAASMSDALGEVRWNPPAHELGAHNSILSEETQGAQLPDRERAHGLLATAC